MIVKNIKDNAADSWNSIHEDKELNAILQNERIVNTNIMYPEDSGGEFLHGLNMYLREYTDYRDEPEVLRLTGPLHLDFTELRDKTLSLLSHC